MKESPIVIGGVGGSGTRLFAKMLKDLGFYIGGDLNTAEDNLWFTLLFKRQELWPPEAHKKELVQLLKIFYSAMSQGSLPDTVDPVSIRRLASRARLQHSAEWLSERVESLLSLKNVSVDSPWGFKEPNSHIFLPILMDSFETMKYIHVMRHGVDMAFSGNQNQLKFWGSRVLGRSIDPLSPADSLAYWCAIHRRVSEIEAQQSERFLMLDYDAFCEAPERLLEQIMTFLGVDDTSLMDGWIDTYVKPTSVNRRKGQDLSIFSGSDLAYVQSLVLRYHW